MLFRKHSFQLLVTGTAMLALAGCGLIPHSEGTRAGAAADGMTMGNPNAPITFIEYGAPTCPHCAHFALDGLPHLKEEYIDKGKVYFVFRAFPLSAADSAVEAIGRCLPREQYFPFMDMMFSSQSEWDPDGYMIPDVHVALIKMAGRAGMSQDKADACMDDRSVQERINAVAQEGFEKYNVRAVPTFLINGKIVEGYGGWPQLKAEVDALLPKP
jgi:protein-disulfide isomerase